MSPYEEEDIQYAQTPGTAKRVGDLIDTALGAISSIEERAKVLTKIRQISQAFAIDAKLAPGRTTVRALRIFADAIEQGINEWAEGRVAEDSNDAWSKRRAG